MCQASSDVFTAKCIGSVILLSEKKSKNAIDIDVFGSKIEDREATQAEGRKKLMVEPCHFAQC